MRHPHPFLYIACFGSLIAVGVLNAAKFWTEKASEASWLYSAVVSIGIAVLPLAAMAGIVTVFGIVMIYLGTMRVGNRVKITGGEYANKTGVVTKHHGIKTSGWVHIRLDKTNDDITVSPYQCSKIGFRSHVF